MLFYICKEFEQMIKKYIKYVAIFLLAALLIAYFILSQEKTVKNTKINKVGDELVIVDSGGDNTKARITANIIPFENLSGIKATVISSSDYHLLTDGVERNENILDVVNIDSYLATNIGNKGYLEPINYNVVSKKDLRLCDQYAVGAEIYANIIAYNMNDFDENSCPKNFKDFFDTKRVLGKRAIPLDPVGLLEAALLADGVPEKKLYPLDVKRALKKLESIKSEIVWWKDGDDPINLLNNNKISLAIAWSGRLILAKERGASIGFTFNQGIFKTASWVVPKDAPNIENAMKFIGYVSTKDAQAAYCKEIPYSSSNKNIPYTLSPTVIKQMGGDPLYSDYQLFVDNDYWAKNFDDIIDTFNKWVKNNEFSKVEL